MVNVNDLDCKETFSHAKHMIMFFAVEVSGFSRVRTKELLGINVSLPVYQCWTETSEGPLSHCFHCVTKVFGFCELETHTV